MPMDLRPGPVHYRLLSEHFQVCVDLPEREREKYLSGPHLTDDSIREELRSLLQYHARPSGTSRSPLPSRPSSLRPLPPSGRRPFLTAFLVLGTSTFLL